MKSALPIHRGLDLAICWHLCLASSTNLARVTNRRPIRLRLDPADEIDLRCADA